ASHRPRPLTVRPKLSSSTTRKRLCPKRCNRPCCSQLRPSHRKMGGGVCGRAEFEVLNSRFICRSSTQNFHQQLRIVGNDPVHSHLRCPQHVTLIVNSPGDHLFVGSVDLLNQTSRQQMIMRHNVVNRQYPPAAKLPASLGQRAKDERTVEGMQPADHARKER